MIPYDATWARVREFLVLSAKLRQRSRIIHAEAERQRSHLTALYRHSEYLWALSEQAHE
jgi:hypothetical protein